MEKEKTGKEGEGWKSALNLFNLSALALCILCVAGEVGNLVELRIGQLGRRFGAQGLLWRQDVGPLTMVLVMGMGMAVVYSGFCVLLKVNEAQRIWRALTARTRRKEAAALRGQVGIVMNKN